jgi:cytidylate kinase
VSPPLVIAIDGPAGSGKSTTARAVAQRLALPHVDTGAMYRAVTLKALNAGVDPGDEEGLDRLLDGTELDLVDGRVLLDQADVTAALRSAAVTASVSQIAAVPKVRHWMLQRQRRLVAERGGVMEGRDIGTVVLPSADLKVFLTAAPEVRARRRAAELQGEGVATTVTTVLEEIEARDRTDAQREASPLRMASDAIVIDSTGRSVDDVVGEIVRRSGWS